MKIKNQSLIWGGLLLAAALYVWANRESLGLTKAKTDTSTQKQTQTKTQTKTPPPVPTKTGWYLSGTTYVDVNATLGRPEILAFQKWLNTRGQNISTDGVWGPQTQAATTAVLRLNSKPQNLENAFSLVGSNATTEMPKIGATYKYAGGAANETTTASYVFSSGSSSGSGGVSGTSSGSPSDYLWFYPTTWF